MEQILEIREGCTTPEQLVKSLAFSHFLKIYKNEFIQCLSAKEKLTAENKKKIQKINKITARDFLDILEHPAYEKGKTFEDAKSLVKFIDGAFHHYRGTGYSRFVRLQNNIVANGQETLETADTVKDRVSKKADMLSNLLLDSRRRILDKVHLDGGVRRTHGMEASSNITAGEISGHYVNLPADYLTLAHVPVTIAADIQTGIDYSTPSNKRAYPFYELEHNPLNTNKLVSEEWVCIPLKVGDLVIMAYIHKSRGSIEMEPGLMNLFPFAEVADFTEDKHPDGLFFFGDPRAEFKDLGYHWDEKNQILVGLVPNMDELKYFGYAKKPVLTLHNVLAIRNGQIPLHCGCTRYVVGFDEETDEPYVEEMLVKADDMGKIRLQKDTKGNMYPEFFGTETGAFACLDGFSEQAKLAMKGREVGYNQGSGSNSRQIVPITDADEVMTGSQLDVLLYMNNFSMIETGAPVIDAEMSVEDAIKNFRRGERVAAGSTDTHRGEKEISYWANPFPLLQDPDGTILHQDLYDIFQVNEKLFLKEAASLMAKNEFRMGVAYSQLMAGAYKDNSDADLERCGYGSRENVEQEGPVRLAEQMIDLVHKVAIEKRDRTGETEVSVTIALVGDSRTGKSETAEKMEGILGLQLI
jgi:hypothetical protein